MTRVDRIGRRRMAMFMLVTVGLLAAATGSAQLRLDITEGVRDAVPIAVVPFGGQAGATDGEVGAVIANDLRLSGRFAPLDDKELVARPTSGAEIRFQDWRLLATDFIVVGRVEPQGTGRSVIYELFNVKTGQLLLSERVAATERGLRPAAHRAADAIYERLTGIPGAFSTRVAYVAVEGRPPAQRFRLIVADADGYNPRTIAESAEPIMSPAWSPDGQSVAYVSFESKMAAIYVQRLTTGERRRVSARAGINGAPAFSPDGRRLALTLSRDGNLDVYTLDLATQTLARITTSEAIDTEPEWSKDGGSLFFTSDRAGSAQVYRVALDGAKQAERVTFANSYNARPRMSPDGKELALVTLEGGGYRIAVLDLATRNLRVLTNARQDEAPSFAPNGATIIYATQDRGRGALAMVSSDGRFQQRLSSDRGDVREPAWGLFAVR